MKVMWHSEFLVLKIGCTEKLIDKRFCRLGSFSPDLSYSTVSLMTLVTPDFVVQ